MFPFLDLPAELRKMVYDICLIQKTMSIHGVDIHMKPENLFLAFKLRGTWDGVLLTRRGLLDCDTARMTYQVERKESGNNFVPNLFFANRQICDESRATFYSKNQFHFHGVYSSILTCMGFLSDRPESARFHLRSITIDICATSIPILADNWSRFCNELDKLPELRQVKIILDTRVDMFRRLASLMIQWIDCSFFMRQFLQQISRLVPIRVSEIENGIEISLKLEKRFQMMSLSSVLDFEKLLFDQERSTPGWFSRTKICTILSEREELLHDSSDTDEEEYGEYGPLGAYKL